MTTMKHMHLLLCVLIILTKSGAAHRGDDNAHEKGLRFLQLDLGIQTDHFDSSKQHNLFIRKPQGIGATEDISLYKNLSPFVNFAENPETWSRLYSAQDISFQCLNDTEKVIADISAGEPYAVRFLDADGKLPAGLLLGGWNWVGDYQECISTESTFNDFTGHSFKGKYFSVALYRNNIPVFNEKLPLVIGTCLPDSCGIADARAVAEVAFSALKSLNITVGFVNTSDSPKYDGAAIAALVIIGIIGVLVLFGTCAEIVFPLNKLSNAKEVLNGNANFGANTGQPTEKTGLLADDIVHQQYVVPKKDRFIGFLLCFSFIKNSRKLFSTDTANGPLACLNGLRVISMWWVIQGHTYSFIPMVSSNAAYAESVLPKRFTFQPIINGTFSVDTFFFLSGVLVAYLAFKELHTKGKLSWIYYFLHRYWRLTPLYAFVLLIYMSLSFHVVSGPFQWMGTDLEHGLFAPAMQKCRDYWWTNLLYINNFYPDYGATTGGCMAWGWYLANDMQFYIFISPLLILLFKRHKIAGAITSVALILSCIAIRAFLVSWYGVRFFNGPSTKHTDDPWGHQSMYVRPWARMSVYIIGFLTGYVVQHIRWRLKLNKILVFVGWCFASGSALAVIYGLLYYFNHPGTQMTLVASGFYTALSRTVWALCLSWLVIACASGYGGPVNHILSWKIWAPMGRLTYAAYLVHPIIMTVYIFNLVTPFHFSDLTAIYIFVSNLVFSYLIAYIVSILVEAPMMAIEKLLLSKKNS